MYTLDTTNVSEALWSGMKLLQKEGVHRKSRAGDVFLMDGPVTTLYREPTERVLFYPERDANPFFHFMEGLWMLAGRNDVEWISRYNSSFVQFSDDGVTFHGAYGHRWMDHFVQMSVLEEAADDEVDEQTLYTPFNQLACAAQMLRDNPDERRVVISMWDPEIDLGRVGKDIPCNLQILFSINLDGALDMTVTNRSNDIIWGAYGANAVHFSMMMEVFASWVGVAVGRYWQISNNYHGYEDTFGKHASLLEYEQPLDPYSTNEVSPFPMVNTQIDTWMGDLKMFIEEGPVTGFKDRFFRKVVVPMDEAWSVWKNKDEFGQGHIDRAIDACKQIQATDWRKACIEWLERRRK